MNQPTTAASHLLAASARSAPNRGTALPAAAWLLCALALAVPTEAFAFDNFASYGEPVIGTNPGDPNGGGEGRYFTGSPVDGFSCAVCHFGGPEPDGVEVTIRPDPFEAGYQAGQVYTITVILPRAPFAAAANLELVDETGAGGEDGAGVLTVATPVDRCAATAMQDEATSLANVGDRTIVGADVCGATQMTAEWTAPPVRRGAVWINAAIVAADGTGDPTGDYTVVYSRVIPPAGTDPEAGRVSSTCGAAPPGPPGSRLALSALALLLRAQRRGLRSGSRRGSRRIARRHSCCP